MANRETDPYPVVGYLNHPGSDWRTWAALQYSFEIRGGHGTRYSQLYCSYVSRAVLWRRPQLGFLTVSPYAPSLSLLGAHWKDALE